MRACTGTRVPTNTGVPPSMSGSERTTDDSFIGECLFLAAQGYLTPTGNQARSSRRQLVARYRYVWVVQIERARDLLAAALPSLIKPIEQAPGIGAREGLQPMRLILLDAVACDRTVGAKDCGLSLHLVVPHVGIEFADVHENAHLRDRLKLRGAGSPHVSGESRNGEEVLRIGCRNMK